MTTTLSQRTARQELQERRGGINGNKMLSLSSNVCRLIVAAGGPTFKSAKRHGKPGFRCNQTGEWVPASQTKMYATRAVNGARKSIQEQVVAVAEKEKQREISLLPTAQIHHQHYMVQCPNCGQMKYRVCQSFVCQCDFCKQEFYAIF